MSSALFSHSMRWIQKCVKRAANVTHAPRILTDNRPRLFVRRGSPREPDESLTLYFICSGRCVWRPSCWDRFQFILVRAGPVTTAYRIWGRLETKEGWASEKQCFHIQPGELSVYFDQTTVGESGGTERSSIASVSDYIKGVSLFNKVVYLCRDVFHYCQTVRITIWTVQFLPRVTLQSCSPFHGCQLRWFTGPISKLFVHIKHLDINLCKYVSGLGG